MEIIFRFTHNKLEKQWLKVIKKTNVEVTEGKQFSEHGNLVDTAMAGNGYHGRCCNCGLALVTDLGFNSWSGTECKIEHKEVTSIDYKYIWVKNKERASKLSCYDAHEHQNNIIHQQGWGKYNFIITKIK